MEKIVIEINGIRHKAVKDKENFICDNCSLFHKCNSNGNITDLCAIFNIKDCHFEKEEEW